MGGPGGYLGGRTQHGHWRQTPGASIGAKRVVYGKRCPTLTSLLTSYLIMPPYTILIGYKGAAFISLFCFFSEITFISCPLAYSYTLAPHIPPIRVFNATNVSFEGVRGATWPPTGAYYENPRQETEDNKQSNHLARPRARCKYEKVIKLNSFFAHYFEQVTLKL